MSDADGRIIFQHIIQGIGRVGLCGKTDVVMLHSCPITNKTKNQNENKRENKAKNDSGGISCDGSETRSADGKHGPDLTIRHKKYLHGKTNESYL